MIEEYSNHPEPSLEEVEFAIRPDPRCPCILLLDTSTSMGGDPIAALNEGLQIFQECLMMDELASRRVEVAIVTFDSQVTVAQDFITADQYEPKSLTAFGATCMGSAILKALDMVQRRKEIYKKNGVKYYRPWIFMITDGEPQGEPQSVVEDAARHLRQAENSQSVAFFAVGVEGANMERLSQIVVRQPVKLRGLDFGAMFQWLSTSVTRVTQSKIGEQTELPPSTGWKSV